MRIDARLCYLCWTDGQYSVAIGWYQPEDESWDVCRKHAKFVKENGEYEIVEFDEKGEATESRF